MHCSVDDDERNETNFARRAPPRMQHPQVFPVQNTGTQKGRERPELHSTMGNRKCSSPRLAGARTYHSHFYSTVLSSRIRCNSFKTIAWCTRYSTVFRGAFGPNFAVSNFERSLPQKGVNQNQMFPRASRSKQTIGAQNKCQFFAICFPPNFRTSEFDLRLLLICGNSGAKVIHTTSRSSWSERCGCGE